jgi:hypothetical protein
MKSGRDFDRFNGFWHGLYHLEVMGSPQQRALWTMAVLQSNRGGISFADTG